MRHRPSIVLLSALVDLLVIGAIVIASGLGPDALPVPHRLLAAPVLRTVQLPDIRLPPSRQQAQATRSLVTPPHGDIAPVAPPTALPPESDRPASNGIGVPGGNEAARTFEGNVGVIDGQGLPRTEAPAPPAQPVRMHSGVDAPRKLRDVLPAYPAAARAAGVHGVVILEVTISEHGMVTAARVLRSVPGLDQAALDAVTQWTFAPARLNGQAIPVVMTVTVNFALSR